jgi:ubiquinone/menaquinone biosynthesis C-methylase UbiE
MSDLNSPTIVRHVADGQICCDPVWEQAYAEFETPEQEIEKFKKRLLRFGAEKCSNSSRIVELFCGRGNSLVAWERLGFERLSGVDLSASLLEQYCGPATLYLADCRDIPIDSDSIDIAVVQGGLHHLPDPMTNLGIVCDEVRRILVPGGEFWVVEPWETLFLKCVHLVVANPMVRKVWRKGNAMATMVDRERATYEDWLSKPKEILDILASRFEVLECRIGLGKLAWRGRSV